MLRLSQSQTNAMGKSSGGNPKQCCPEPYLTENIILVGSEQHYNLFWLKMMFVAPAFAMGDRGINLRRADRTTLIYCDKDYTNHEKLPLEFLKNERGIRLLPFTSAAVVNNHINTRPVGTKNGQSARYLIQDMAIFCHGLPNQLAIDMGRFGTSFLVVDKTSIRTWSPSSFMQGGRILSYACRTGVGRQGESFANDAAAQPENSLAQAMADHLRVDVWAFLTRTLFREVLRAPADSDRIEATMRAARPAQNGQVIQIPPEHEGLPHPGLDDGFMAGSHAAGTNAYALWRKQGARMMPYAAETPTGLSQAMRQFRPR
ncbi:MAG: hypothetical protein IPK82_30945 [Polyangiaceae bacterium]|nr:hypothetical protein [Polyangiaceae bacterium]